MFYSPSTGGFYDPAIHRDVPTDAVAISRERYGELLAARSAGKLIASDRTGRPIVKARRFTVDELRQRAIAAVKAEARRRILAVASLERQANDAASIAIEAFAGAGTDLEGALDRRIRIDAIRAASNAIEAQIARMPAANLTDFDPSTHPNWPDPR